MTSHTFDPKLTSFSSLWLNGCLIYTFTPSITKVGVLLSPSCVTSFMDVHKKYFTMVKLDIKEFENYLCVLIQYSGDLHYELVSYSNGLNLLDRWVVHYSGHGFFASKVNEQSFLLVCIFHTRCHLESHSWFWVTWLVYLTHKIVR